MASKNVSRRVAESYLTDLLDGKHISDDVDIEATARTLLDAAYDIEFRPRTKAGEVIILTFQLDPNDVRP